MKNNPGPGNYEYNTSIGTGKKYFMGVKTNSSAILGNNTNPGPGNYHPDYKWSRENHSKVGFGSGKRAGGGDQGVPGPGTYDSRPKSGKQQPTWVFGTEQKMRPQRTTNKQAPGPGNYDYRSLFDNNVDKNLGTSMVSRRPQSALSYQKNPGNFFP